MTTAVKNILRLSRKLHRLVEEEQPSGEKSLLNAILKHFDENDLQLMIDMDDTFGYKRCNNWMVKILDRTTAFRDEGNGYVISRKA